MSRRWKPPRTSHPEEGIGMRVVGNTVFVADGWMYFPKGEEANRKVVHTTFNTFRLRTATPAELFAAMITGGIDDT